MDHTDHTPTSSNTARRTRHYSPLSCEVIAKSVRIAALGNGLTGCLQT
jgi:hypothetical protein